jgi:hypothetical protein
MLRAVYLPIGFCNALSLLLGSHHWAMPAFAVLLIGFVIRANFAVFHLPIATRFGWLRADFLMAIARKNVAWGIGPPSFGAVANG